MERKEPHRIHAKEFLPSRFERRRRDLHVSLAGSDAETYEEIRTRTQTRNENHLACISLEGTHARRAARRSAETLGRQRIGLPLRLEMRGVRDLNYFMAFARKNRKG